MGRTDNCALAKLVGSRSVHRENPVSAYFYFWFLGSAWRGFIFPLGLFLLAAAYLGRQIGGSEGLRIAVAIGMFPIAFCQIGSLDALWRYPFAKSARNRYVRNEHEFDPQSRRLMRIAGTSDGILLLQLVGAALISWRIAT